MRCSQQAWAGRVWEETRERSSKTTSVGTACWLLAIGLWGCPEDPVKTAHDLSTSGAHQAAGEAYVDAARRDPANVAAWDGAVEVWCRTLIDVDECLRVLELEMEILGNFQRHRDVLSEVLEARARARLERGLLSAALSDLDRAEHAAPERTSVLTARAAVWMRMKDWDQAQAAIDRALRQDPNHPEAKGLANRLPPREDRFGGP
jgi:tetratricopeptide (TPR) repeat protein